MATPAIEIAPRVYRIPTLGDFINSYALVDDDEQVTLIDCGLKRAPARIVRGLTHIGKHPRDVTRIVLTHAHNDHAGGARNLVASTAVDGVAAHHDDAHFITTGVMPPRDSTRGLGRLLKRAPSGTFDAVAVSQELSDGDELDIAGGLRVIHTPGHTPGHISLLLPDSEVLITGDAIFNMLSRRTWPFAAFCTSFSQTQQTAQVLADLEYRTAAFTHGPEIRQTGREAVRGFLSKGGRR